MRDTDPVSIRLLNHDFRDPSAATFPTLSLRQLEVFELIAGV